ncbi:MAG TPA: response regulator, partial [Planctomycetia bacterium]|nr:response regulator [Planctomycetia bacterium]
VSVDTDLVYELAADLPPVEADVTQLHQVIINLVSNASEALEFGRGTVTVRTGTAHGETSVPAVFLEVTDTGFGMTAEVMEKVFDPFFTTKFTGRGLGLAVVQGIVRGHGGALEVRSEVGRGSAFRLLLPCSPHAAAPPDAPVPSEGWRGTGTVLVIDDEPGVRDIAGRMLKRAGFQVLVAAHGEEGVATLREAKETIDIVVLDLTMPRMGGIETAKALRSVRPDLPVILMSGYTLEEATLQSADFETMGYVQKPFKSPELLAAVRDALGRSRAAARTTHG